MFRTKWRNTVHQQFQNWILLGWSIFVWLSSIWPPYCLHAHPTNFILWRGCSCPRFHGWQGSGIWSLWDSASSFGWCSEFWMSSYFHRLTGCPWTPSSHISERERERLLTQIDRHAPRSYFQRCRFRHSIETLQSIVPYQVFVSVFVFLMILNISHNDQWWCCRTIRSSLYLMLSKRKLPCEDIKVTFSVLTVDRKKPKLKGPHHSPKIWG